MRVLGLLFVALGVVTTACGAQAPPGADPPPGTSPPTTSPPTTSGALDPAQLPGGELAPCPSPEGFTISAPVAWASNRGDVVAACSYFDPEPFDVPEASDLRPAAISASIDAVEYARAAAAVGDGADRAHAVLDGRPAVRLSYRASGDGLREAGTPVTSYLVDLGVRDGRPATLILSTVLVSTVGSGSTDYARNVVVLDRMARTLTVGNGRGGGPAVVLGSSASPQVVAREAPGGACLEVGGAREAACLEAPAADGVRAARLRAGGERLVAGVAGARVWRVDLVTTGNQTLSRLTVPVPGTELGAYAFPVGTPRADRLVLRDVTGGVVGVVEPDGT